jgi:hypothetical protein
MIRPTLIFLALLAPSRGADDPRAVAEAALGAWTRRDATALVASAHPELLAHCRAAPAVRARLDGAPDKKSDAEIVAAVCRTLEELAPPNPRVWRTEHIAELMTAGDLAVVTFTSFSRLRNDASVNSSRRTDVFLKRSGGEWRLLWLPGVLAFIDSQWDPREDLRPVTLVSDRSTMVSVKGVLRTRTMSRDTFHLPPGTYDVVGTRRGFRDVKWLLIVPRDPVTTELTVVCTVPATQ